MDEMMNFDRQRRSAAVGDDPGRADFVNELGAGQDHIVANG